MTTDAMSGRRGKMTSSGPKQHVVWAPLKYVFFRLLFILLTHNIYVSTTTTNYERHHATTEWKDDRQGPQTMSFGLPEVLFKKFPICLFFLLTHVYRYIFI